MAAVKRLRADEVNVQNIVDSIRRNERLKQKDKHRIPAHSLASKDDRVEITTAGGSSMIAESANMKNIDSKTSHGTIQRRGNNLTKLNQNYQLLNRGGKTTNTRKSLEMNKRR